MNEDLKEVNIMITDFTKDGKCSECGSCCSDCLPISRKKSRKSRGISRNTT